MACEGARVQPDVVGAGPDASSESDLSADVAPASTVTVCFPDLDGDGYGQKAGNIQVKGPNAVCPSGYVSKLPLECNDKDPSIHPGAVESCNQVDDNCDGETDEGTFGVCQTACGKGSHSCTDGILGPCDAPEPVTETCNGKDDDCDGVTDEGCCTPGTLVGDTKCAQGPVDFVFVTDRSGSMQTKLALVIKALQGFVDVMDTSDRALFVTFNEEPTVHGQLSSDKSTLEAILQEILSDGGAGGTSIGLGLDAGIKAFEANDRRKVLVLLTDGQGDFAGTYYKATAEAKKITIYALGFGEQSLKSKIANVVTSDGAFFVVSSAEELPLLYQYVFHMVEYKSWKECGKEGNWVTKSGVCKT